MRQTFRIFALALPLLALRVRPASAQSYGLGDQVLAVGAPEFHPLATGVAYSFGASDLYLYGGNNTFVAPITLPDGAEIFQICVYANVPDASSGVSLQLVAGKLAPGGEQPGVVYDPETVAVDNIAIGYGTVCTETFSYIFHETADVDGDGTTEHVFHVLYAISEENAGIGGGRVFWRRQVSAPARDSRFRRRAHIQSSIPIHRGPSRGGDYCGLRRWELLSERFGHPRPDGGVSGEGTRPSLAGVATASILVRRVSQEARRVHREARR
jgi:hypothetical protein